MTQMVGRDARAVAAVEPDAEPQPYVIALSEEGTEVLAFDPASGGGWMAYFSASSTARRVRVMLRARRDPASGVLAICEARVIRPDSSILREIPLTRIEAAINQPQHRRVLAAQLKPEAVLRTDGDRSVRYLQPPQPEPPARPDLALPDPGGYRKPDEFYQRAADRYLWLAAVSRRPAQELAVANDVPVATVHRWIREAKARGLMPPLADRRK